MFSSRKIDFLVLVIFCAAAFWWRLGSLGLIDPDEPFYAQTAHEMAQTGDWLTPQIYGKPQFEKPILYYWLLSGSFKMLGESEFTGRLPTAVFSTALVLLTWSFGCAVWNRRAGFLAALVLATGLILCVMSRLMLTDVPLAFFLAGAVFSYWFATRDHEKRNYWLFLHVACTGLAVLTKGPIGSLIPFMATVAFTLTTRRKLLFSGKGFWWGLAAYAVIVVPWYGLMFAQHARQFWEEFFVRDNFLRLIHAEHPANNHIWYYPGLLLVGSIPWLPMVVMAVWRLCRGWRANEGEWFQWCWLLTSLVFLTIAQSKLPSYGFYLFVPLGLIIGHTLDEFLERGFVSVAEKRTVIILSVVQCLIGALAGSLVKVARPFEAPALFLSALLAIGVFFLLTGRLRSWLLANAASSIGLLAGALTIATPAVQAESSARPVAEALLRMRHDDEPILCGKFLVRGIIYYTHAPVTVLAKNAQPFWAAHPLPVVVWGKAQKEIKEFMAAHPTALCTVRKSEWKTLADLGAFPKAEDFQEIGENVVFRARAEGSPKPAAWTVNAVPNTAK